MIKFHEEKLDKSKPVVAAALAIRAAMKLDGDEKREASDVSQIIRTVRKNIVIGTNRKRILVDAAAAVIGKFVRNGDHIESSRKVMAILRDDIEKFIDP